VAPVDYRASLVTSTASDGPYVALTMDDGPDETWTPKMLDLLDEHDVQATFCVVGWRARAFPELIERIHREGHLLCDHTVTHDLHLNTRDEDTVASEVIGGLDAIQEVLPLATVEWFRAPGGNWSAYMVDVAAEAGMRSLSWSVDPRDWEQPGTDVIVERVYQQLRPGGVILLHDAGGDRHQSVEALEILLRELPAAGWEFDKPAGSAAE
jgi:peptidoglycan/xylan/chitin deacetylase (PgdA/CDA1 family)